ncbi:serine/threonine protein kinase [Cryptococcus bacillisporus CA1873]|uniref:Serine/threonine protein kinase n=1 Tax=Cryptococcus bacillisporus CA1873 TaxID=1296111 RepID=A0ABR5B7M7_CRYGA|nr:serine/threonine protein kinase [Cryptococcus bacillisporus CA1873]|eukprot:KIR59608.1 serine/threonine protein kinase [Cryptococcus gattii CA1873]
MDNTSSTDVFEVYLSAQGTSDCDEYEDSQNDEAPSQPSSDLQTVDRDIVLADYSEFPYSAPSNQWPEFTGCCPEHDDPPCYVDGGGFSLPASVPYDCPNYKIQREIKRSPSKSPKNIMDRIQATLICVGNCGREVLPQERWLCSTCVIIPILLNLAISLNHQMASSGGDLQKFIKTYGPLSQFDSRYTFTQLLSAVTHLQTRHMVHHYIKPENILIDLDGNVFLSDFGVAHIFDQPYLPALPVCGTVVYAEPELAARKTRYSPFKSDIWSLGIILFFLLTGRTPYIGYEEFPGLHAHIADVCTFVASVPVDYPGSIPWEASGWDTVEWSQGVASLELWVTAAKKQKERRR